MSETKLGSTGSLISDFVGAIKSGMEKVNKYKTNCNAFKQEVSGYADDLKALIDQLEACIGEIEKLQGQYVAFIQQLQIIQENLRIQIRNAASGAKSGADTECNEKILQIKNDRNNVLASSRLAPLGIPLCVALSITWPFLHKVQHGSL